MVEGVYTSNTIPFREGFDLWSLWEVGGVRVGPRTSLGGPGGALKFFQGHLGVFLASFFVAEDGPPDSSFFLRILLSTFGESQPGWGTCVRTPGC